MPRSGNARHAASHEHRPRGSLTTFHANTPRDAVARMETMIMMTGFDMPLKAMRQQIASAVDSDHQANRLQGGIRRKITHITEIIGMEQDTIVMQDIYKYEQEASTRPAEPAATSRPPATRPTFHGERWSKPASLLPAMSAFRQRVMLESSRTLRRVAAHLSRDAEFSYNEYPPNHESDRRLDCRVSRQ